VQSRRTIPDLPEKIQGGAWIVACNALDDSEQICLGYAGPDNPESRFHFLPIVLSILENTSSWELTFPARMSSSPCEINFRSPRAVLIFS
jgi:hypothetical protein